MAHYDRVMRQRKSALAEARDQKCMACFVMVRPQIWQEIRTNEQIITCNSCGRILYFDPASEPVAPEPVKKKSKARAAERKRKLKPSSPSKKPAPRSNLHSYMLIA